MQDMARQGVLELIKINEELSNQLVDKQCTIGELEEELLKQQKLVRELRLQVEYYEELNA